MFPIENIRGGGGVPIFFLNGGQRLPIVLLQPDHEDKETKPENNDDDEEEKEDDDIDTDTDREILSILLKDPNFLRPIFPGATNIQDLQMRQIKSSVTKPKPQDLKKKGLDCSVTCTKKLPHGNYEKGQCSYTTCVICSAIFPLGEAIQSTGCVHAYCTECFPVYLIDKIQEDASKVKCPASKCEVVFGPEGVRAFIPKQVYDRWRLCTIEASVLAQPLLVQCPLEWCRKWLVDDERGFLIRACPNCWRLFCMKCRVGWHMGRTCSQYQFELLGNDQMDLGQLLSGTRRRRRGRGGLPDSCDSGRRRFVILD